MTGFDQGRHIGTQGNREAWRGSSQSFVAARGPLLPVRGLRWSTLADLGSIAARASFRGEAGSLVGGYGTGDRSPGSRRAVDRQLEDTDDPPV